MIIIASLFLTISLYHLKIVSMPGDDAVFNWFTAWMLVLVHCAQIGFTCVSLSDVWGLGNSCAGAWNSSLQHGNLGISMTDQEGSGTIQGKITAHLVQDVHVQFSIQLPVTSNLRWHWHTSCLHVPLSFCSFLFGIRQNTLLKLYRGASYFRNSTAYPYADYW